MVEVRRTTRPEQQINAPKRLCISILTDCNSTVNTGLLDATDHLESIVVTAHSELPHWRLVTVRALIAESIEVVLRPVLAEAREASLDTPKFKPGFPPKVPGICNRPVALLVEVLEGRGEITEETLRRMKVRDIVPSPRRGCYAVTPKGPQ